VQTCALPICGRGELDAVRQFSDCSTQDLARPRLWQLWNNCRLLEEGDRTDPLADEVAELLHQLLFVALRASLEHDEADRNLALELIVHPDHGALGDVLVRGEDLFHGAGGKPMAGDVDDVVDAPHDREVPVLVEEPAVAGQVEAWIPGEVRALEGGVVVVERGQASGRKGELDGDGAVLAARNV